MLQVLVFAHFKELFALHDKDPNQPEILKMAYNWPALFDRV